MAAQAEVGEVIVVDDESTDRTAAILGELASRVPKLKVLRAGELPAGWVGKNHAVAVGAAAASGDWLLFTDADTYHFPGAMKQALGDAAEHRAVLVSYSPEQEMETLWERALIPFVYCRLAAKFSFARVNDPALPDAAANGQFILLVREAYERAGGHGAIAGEVLEDVALARRVKAMGYGIYFTAPRSIVRTRMYRSFGAMWDGWTKNLYPLMGGRAMAVAGELASVLSVPALIALACVLDWRDVIHDFGMFSLSVAILIGLWHVWYGIDLRRNRYPVSYIQYLWWACASTLRR